MDAGVCLRWKRPVDALRCLRRQVDADPRLPLESCANLAEVVHQSIQPLSCALGEIDRIQPETEDINRVWKETRGSLQAQLTARSDEILYIVEAALPVVEGPSIVLLNRVKGDVHRLKGNTAEASVAYKAALTAAGAQEMSKGDPIYLAAALNSTFVRPKAATYAATCAAEAILALSAMPDEDVPPLSLQLVSCLKLVV